MDKTCKHCGNYLVNVGTVGHIDHRSELTAANARIAELERVNAIMDEEVRTKTQALFNLEQDNEHLLEVNGQLQKKAGDIEQGLRDCLNALRMASRDRCPAARRAAALLETE